MPTLRGAELPGGHCIFRDNIWREPIYFKAPRFCVCFCYKIFLPPKFMLGDNSPGLPCVSACLLSRASRCLCSRILVQKTSLEAGDGIFLFVYCPGRGLGGDRKQTFQVLELTGHPEAAGWIGHWLVCTPTVIFYSEPSLLVKDSCSLGKSTTRVLNVLLLGLLPHCISVLISLISYSDQESSGR